MKKTILFIISLLVFCTNITAQGKVDESNVLKSADSCFDATDYVGAVRLYKIAAMAGSADAENKLGVCYLYGTGVDKNGILAANYFRRASEKEYAKAQFNLSTCYYMGIGVTVSHKKSAEWLLKSAMQGYEPAMQNMATYYRQGIGVPIDSAEASVWEKKWHKGIISSPEISDNEPTNKTQLDGKSVVDSTAVADKKTNTADVTLQNGTQCTTEYPAGVPTVKILYPENQSLFHEGNLNVKYQLMGGNAGDTRVTVLIDGIRQPVNRAVRSANSLDVELPHKDCTVMLMANNKNGYGEPASIQLIWDKSYDDVQLPNLYILAMGIGNYNDAKLPPLRYCVKDATDFANAFIQKKGKPYGDVKVKLMRDSEVTREGMFEGLTWLKENATPNDVCLFFYAGHGLRDEKDRFYFVPIDGKTDRLFTCFSAADFRTMIEDIRGKLVVFTDACYSAALMDGNRSAAADHFIEQLRRTKDGLYLFASSASDTKSKEDISWQNGAFTKALVEAVNGAARRDNSEGLTLMDLQLYLDKRVGEMTEHRQVPVAINPNGIENFTLFLYGN